jgi:hypothetical protein
MMRVLKPFQYGNRQLKPGDIFELLPYDSGEEGLAAHRNILMTTHLAEEIPAAERLRDLLPGKRGRYKRRDMRAEE